MDRLRTRLAVVVERRRLRRTHALPVVPADGGDTPARRWSVDRRTGVVPGLIAVGSALLALGGLWAWQSWSARSAPPVDDLLPLLVADEADAVPDEADAVADDASPGVDATAAANPPGAAAEPTTDVVADSESVQADDAADDDGRALVHVSGAVRAPGVVVLGPGARVFEAVDLAGGASRDADLDRVNLAAPVVDGERIHVPRVGEDVIPALVPSVRPSAADVGGAAATDPIIDINAATAGELESLPGVGPTIAQAIVQTRTDRGPFLSVDELLDVPGIGETKLAQMRAFVVVG